MQRINELIRTIYLFYDFGKIFMLAKNIQEALDIFYKG